ncbi:MAG TPA: PhnD/SsuA/transferrin family substrate-binding protein [Thermoanaerobaculales bacterium]|nr:PhnD/SsuA/transferrin family substrate-binding protein [Thermoanaerobaculales bacterium]HPA80122.1 PhnD/SsuA/transferrin family substrate-binding protein [Thermoanaerobaculales bacterium]HQL30580.1 PhnD/SsuA/transferrin family substrate-binding protein [Thermoanaerobaculales bacterium]HQN95875.1 PhnD/SsuA/transferrin family substrate-binding protein [Thermoanaerobaculales bacterium]HQP43931.1 PhnD/SsuA/transferrin family substrate-binding protein [Thermoanaerobaculales bacterium]
MIPPSSDRQKATTQPPAERGWQWLPRAGWLVVVGLLAVFVWGLDRRGRLESMGEQAVQMLFVPSVEQGTLVRRGDELARFVRADSGLTLRSQVPTSYAAVIQALGAGQADVAWIPPFAYVVANARYGAEARLQVVRSVDRYAIVVVRSSAGEPQRLEDLAGRRVAFSASVQGQLRTMVMERLDGAAPGWVEVAAGDDRDAVRLLVERQDGVDAAVSRHVYSAPHDLVGDGRKELEADRPGTLRETRVVDTTETAAPELSSVYYGCVLTRSDSGIHRLEDLQGRSFAFSDETSTSGHIFPRVLLQRSGIALGHVLFAGGHPNVVQAVYDGKVAAGATFYSPPSAINERDGTLVADARFLIVKNMKTAGERAAYLEQVRVLALTDPIPNDVCCVRRGFPEAVWQRFAASLDRFLATPDGQSAYYDLVAGVAAAPCSDADFDGFRSALRSSGVSAVSLLEAAEERLRGQREKAGGAR